MARKRNRRSAQPSVSQRAQAHDHSTVFQQGQGTQHNYNLTVAAGEGVPRIRDPRDWPLVRDVADPIVLGVHRNAALAGNPIAAYVPRDIDDQVHSMLGSGQSVLLVGDSAAGKSRCAYEAMRTVCPQHRLVTPDGPMELRLVATQLANATDAGPFVLWLDDLESYLGADGLTAPLLADLRRTAVVVLATMRAEQHTLLARTAASSRDRRAAIGADVIEQIEPIRLDRLWSQAERDRAAETDDSRIAAALQAGDSYGVAEYLAAGPQLLGEWRGAWAPGTSPRGAALIAAAVDLRRVGLLGPIPRTTLLELHQGYLDRRGGRGLRPEDIDTALDWATQLRYGTTSLLLPDDNDTYGVFDYLVDTVSRAADEPPLRDVWLAALRIAGPSDLTIIGFQAIAQDEPEIAEQAHQRSLDTAQGPGRIIVFETKGDPTAKELFRRWVEAAPPERSVILDGFRDDEDEELRLARLWAGTGDPQREFALAHLLETRGQHSEAESRYRRAARLGNIDACVKLGALLAARGKHGDAEHWYRTAAEVGHPGGAFGLGLLYACGDKPDEAEAERWLNQITPADLPTELPAEMARLIGLAWVRHDRFNDAEPVLRIAADAGIAEAAHNLAVLHQELGNSEAAQDWLRRAAELGHGADARLLGDTYGGRDEFGEAEIWWRTAANAGDAEAAFRLGCSLVSHDEFDEGETWLLKALDASVDGVANALAVLYVEWGKLDQAEEWCQRVLDDGDPEPAFALGLAYFKANKLAEAETWWRDAADAGNADAATNLGVLHYHRDEEQEALFWWQKASTAGNSALVEYTKRLNMTPEPPTRRRRRWWRHQNSPQLNEPHE